ncbi:MAG TPA: carboxypeptidase-like regulatory domain-containing protein, partial [Bryobacteraceae bacterium]|nr:carboxypeptidase-like regulatory domain-containing protein [Bryobacteraceae bacterium]
MRTLLPLALAVSGLHAAAIRGTVVEGATGKPLARALVVLEPVRGTEAQAARMRTSSFGTFEFSALPPGAYLITASRDGFAPVHYGQKHWGAAGRPLRL